MKGIVKSFSNSKGYGFIEVAGNEPDVFVHYSAIQKKNGRSLYPGDVVEFKLRAGTVLRQAQDVVVVGHVWVARTRRSA